MPRADTFFECICNFAVVDCSEWHEDSTSESFRFSCTAAALQLHKRKSYPKTYARVRDRTLSCGYGRVPAASTDLCNEEFLVVQVNIETREIFVRRDAFATMPLFVGCAGGVVVLSNRFDRVCVLLQELTINSRAVGLLFAGAINYPATIFNEIQSVGERGVLRWHDGRLTIATPPDATPMAILAEHAGNAAAIPDVLNRRLRAYWERYATAGVPIGAELSCGADSSLVVGYFADRKLPIQPATLMYTGEPGRSIASRLNDFEKRFGLTSHRIFMDPKTEYMLAYMEQANDWRPFYYDHDLYEASFERAASYFVERGIKTIFTGVGGDDIYHNSDPAETIQRDEGLRLFLDRIALPPFLPAHMIELLHDARVPLSRHQMLAVPLLPFSVHRGHVNRNNLYIDYDVWPVAPLADPYIYGYVQTLPMRYRTNKNLMRAYMESRSFPNSIVDPTRNENFSDYFQTWMTPVLQRYTETLLTGSRLHQLGYIDEDVARQTLSDAMATNTKEAQGMLVNIYTVLAVEILLRLLAV